MFIEGDCQLFAKTLRQNMVTSSSMISQPQDNEDDMDLKSYLENIEARQDFRPSWRWL